MRNNLEAVGERSELLEVCERVSLLEVCERVSHRWPLSLPLSLSLSLSFFSKQVRQRSEQLERDIAEEKSQVRASFT